MVVACIPALFAALFAAAAAAVSSIPDARKIALKGTLNGSALEALDRYLESPSLVESRWLVLRVLGIASSAILIAKSLSLAIWTLPASVGVVIAVYGIPSEIGMLLARRMPESALPLILRALRPFEILATPIATPLLLVGRLAPRFVNQSRPPSALLAESEVEILVKEGELNGSLAHEQSEMIQNVLDFREVRAGDIMVPRTQVTAIDVHMPAETVLALIADTTHSRYPVYRERIDNIIGILHVKDLVLYAATHDIKKLNVEEVMRQPVVFTPESQTASSVLMDMRSGRRHHMAVIIDEFGSVSGILTLEDLIEEIVGDIRDEHDDEDPPIVDLGNGRLIVDARVPIGDLSRYLGVELPEDGDYNSLGGFLVERLGQVPAVGATLSDFGLEFLVRDADERHVSKVEIQRQSPNPDSMPPLSTSRRSAA